MSAENKLEQEIEKEFKDKMYRGYGIWWGYGSCQEEMYKGWEKAHVHVYMYYFIVFFKYLWTIDYVLNDNKFSIKLPKLTIMFRIEFKQQNMIEENNREKGGGDVKCTTVPISPG